MSDDHSTDPEYEDLQSTLACVREITRDFNDTASRLRMDKAGLATLSQELEHASGNNSLTPHPALAGPIQEAERSMTRRIALGKELINTAAAFAQKLIQWAETLEQQRQKIQQDRALLLAPSVLLVTGGNAQMSPTDSIGDPIAPNTSCVHDNSGGQPGVLIYTSDWDTYVRYTTCESKLGQLEFAYITYLGDPGESSTMLLDANFENDASPEFNNVSFIHRVIISPQESWYYLTAHDAEIKQEAIVFNAIGGATIPHLTGFSTLAGAGEEEVIAAAPKTIDADASKPVDAGIQWGKGITNQGMPWEDYTETQLPPETRLPPGFKTFDFFNRLNEVATSNVTLNTMTLARLAKPSQLFNALADKIDDAAEFTRYSLGRVTLDSDQIKLRVVRVAIPSTTTGEQMEQINAAIRYGHERKVIVIVVKTK